MLANGEVIHGRTASRARIRPVRRMPCIPEKPPPVPRQSARPAPNPLVHGARGARSEHPCCPPAAPKYSLIVHAPGMSGPPPARHPRTAPGRHILIAYRHSRGPVRQRRAASARPAPRRPGALRAASPTVGAAARSAARVPRHRRRADRPRHRHRPAIRPSRLGRNRRRAVPPRLRPCAARPRFRRVVAASSARPSCSPWSWAGPSPYGTGGAAGERRRGGQLRDGRTVLVIFSI